MTHSTNSQTLPETAAETYLLTDDGIRRIRAELERLIEVRRAEVADDIRLSREYGDVSESTEYAAAKATQAQVELRIDELRSVLARARPLDFSEIRYDSAGIGAEVTLRDLESDEEWSLTLVSTIEADPERDLISIRCPMGEALLGKQVGEVATAATPSGLQRYEIVEIRRPDGLS